MHYNYNDELMSLPLSLYNESIIFPSNLTLTEQYHYGIGTDQSSRLSDANPFPLFFAPDDPPPPLLLPPPPTDATVAQPALPPTPLPPFPPAPPPPAFFLLAPSNLVLALAAS